MAPLITAILPVLGKVFDKVLPDPAAADAAKAKMAELVHAGKLEELQHIQKMFELEVQDKASARSMAIQTGIMPQVILGAIVTLGFFGIATVLFFVDIPETKRDIVLYMFAVLNTAWSGGVMGFFYGSSHGSKTKDAKE